MVEFALVMPSLLLTILAIIDFAGYFGTQLSVEQASQAGARFAAVQACSGSGTSCAAGPWSTATPPAAGSIEAVIVSASGDAGLQNQNCLSNGSAVPSFGPGATVPTGDTSCISISYWDTTAASTPTLCAYFNASTGWVFEGSYTATTCVVANKDLVQVTVGYRYQPTTPLPATFTAALATNSTTDLLVEN
jgi:Flp pilus assembly protein TadG